MTVAAYGNNGNWPAFFTAQSGYKVSCHSHCVILHLICTRHPGHLITPKMQLRVYVSSLSNAIMRSATKRSCSDLAEKLGVRSGIIFGVAIPQEYEKIGLEIQAAVDQAVRESEENGVAKSGRDATPWLLARVKELTKGVSVPSSEFQLGFENM